MPGTTIDQEQFTAYLAMAGMSDATIRNYRAMMQRFVDYAIANGRNPYLPDPLTVRSFAAQLSGTRSLIAHARATISHLCAALEVTDVSHAIPLPRQPKRLTKALDDPISTKLARQAGLSGIKGLAVLVGLYTAARRSEIASLSWRRIDIPAGTLTLERPKTRDFHTVPLHPLLAQALDARRVPGELWVFPGRYGGHVSPATIWHWVDEVAEQAGIGHVTPHQLRHTALTLANDTTGDLRAVQQFAGHTDPAVTAGYTRASSFALKRAVASLDYSGTSPAPVENLFLGVSG